MFSKKRHIRIDNEEWVEDDEEAQVSVVVTFPDSSQWLTNVYTLKCIQSIREDYLSSGNGAYMWSAQPLIIVDRISRQHIEETIDKSIADNSFEFFFEYFGAVEPRQIKQFPEGFFEKDSTIDQDLIIRQASTLLQMLGHSSDEFKERVKEYLFGERVEGIGHLKLLPILEAKNIRALKADFDGQDIKRMWEQAFAEGIDAFEKETIYMDQFLWHVFSYKRKPCLSSEAAVAAFLAVPKQECYVFYQDYNFVLYIENAADLTAADLEGESDIYIVDKSFKWTYVQTHESQCGPYFSSVTAK
jgi:hypothetical protein